MPKAFINKYLTPFWISFPDDEYYPIGFGVTAFNIEEAFALLEEFGYNYHKTAKTVDAIENIEWEKIPCPSKIHPNMGPMVVRGIWCPHHNPR